MSATSSQPTFIFLDDERYPQDVTWIPMPDVEWVIVRNVEEFKVAVKKQFPAYISFDHDLGPEEAGTGHRAAVWLVDYCMDNNTPCPEFRVHSQNPIGAQKIAGLLQAYAAQEDVKGEKLVYAYRK